MLAEDNDHLGSLLGLVDVAAVLLLVVVIVRRCVGKVTTPRMCV